MLPIGIGDLYSQVYMTSSIHSPLSAISKVQLGCCGQTGPVHFYPIYKVHFELLLELVFCEDQMLSNFPKFQIPSGPSVALGLARNFYTSLALKVALI